ncbi:MAG: hypothetical protein IJQ90_02170 [Alphaproteobacteria bacterium]|nr:hypothetical protein [Alphaproteobacteria bacterium]
MNKRFLFCILGMILTLPAYADNPDLMTLIGASSAGSNYAAISNSGNDMNSNASTYNLSSSDHNSFAVDYGNSGVVRGHGRCSTRAGTDPWSNGTYDIISSNFVDSLTDETGNSGAQYCYCGLDSYTPQNGSAQSLSGPWVFRNDYGGAANCADGCANDCANSLMRDGSASLAFRSAVFNAYAPSSSASGDAITTRTYVDNLLSGKQARITTTGTNKLMTYGASAGATPGSRDIVSTLGTSTTATTVPETGPIVAGMANKQDIVNGTADYVMTGTGTAGTVGEKPVYSSTNNYSNALVEAQTVNTAATDAANSELTCVDNDCLLWQITELANLSKLQTKFDMTNLIQVNGSGTCYKQASDGTLSTGTCSAEYTNSMQNGDWGVTFAIDDENIEIRGISVCYLGASEGLGTRSLYQGSIQAYYEAGNMQDGDGACYCKIVSPSNSAWIWRQKIAGGAYCRLTCAKNCGTLFKNDQSFREAMINTME